MPSFSPPYDDDQEPEFTCTNCTRLLYQNELHRFVCFPCEDRTKRQLAALPALFKQLSSALVPSSSRSGEAPVKVSRDAPLPASLHVLDMVGPGGIATKLEAIEDSWRSARGRSIGPRNDGVRWFATTRTKSPDHALADHITYITWNLQWACESYEEIPDDLDVISKVHSQAQAAITGERRRKIAVVCLSEYDDGSQCGAELNIDVSAAITTCRSCGARWGRDDWLRLHEGRQAVA